MFILNELNAAECEGLACETGCSTGSIMDMHVKAQGSRSGKVLGIGYSLTGSQIRIYI